MNLHLQQLLAAAETRAAPTENDNLIVQTEEGSANHAPTELPLRTGPPVVEDRRITRSQGITLAWNPVMNDSQVIVSEDGDNSE